MSYLIKSNRCLACMNSCMVFVEIVNFVRTSEIYRSIVSACFELSFSHILQACITSMRVECLVVCAALVGNDGRKDQESVPNVTKVDASKNALRLDYHNSYFDVGFKG